MEHKHTLLWGFAGTIALTSILRVAQAIGLTRIDLPLMLGTMVTVRRDRAKVYGFVLHLINGWIFAYVYASAFEALHKATWWVGIIVGAVHGFFVLAVGMPSLPGIHPRMATDSTGPEPTRDLQPPGFLALNYGQQTAIATMVAHVIYGAILGQFYPQQRR
jgi:hypothetical protein